MMINTLKVQGISTPILPPIEMALDGNAISFLRGPSGIGKSQLLRAIVDLDPNEGEVHLNQICRSAISAPHWRQLVGYLPAESRWWAPRVIDHFALEPLEMLSFLDLPEHCLQWEISRLSSGERQRLALVRMLTRRPLALLLDEATANLDQENTLRVEQLVEQYRRDHGAAVLWISHDEHQCQRLAGRIFTLSKDGLQEEQWN